MSAIGNRALLALVAAQADRARVRALEAEEQLARAHDAYDVARADAEAARADLARWGSLGDAAAALPMEDATTRMLADVAAMRARIRAAREGRAA